jgi:ribonuclease HI
VEGQDPFAGAGRAESGPRRRADGALQKVVFYVDGACSGNHLGGAQGTMGAGIVARSGGVERAWGIPLGPGTNQRAELLAVGEALRRLRDPAGSAVTLYSDSAYAIGCLTQGWKVKANPELAQQVRALIRECGSFRMIKVPGHAGHPENERANALAVRASLTGEELGE